MNLKSQYLRIINLKEGASESELKTAYKVKAKILHPDMPNGNTDKFRLLNEAYQFLLKNGTIVSDSRNKHNFFRETAKKSGSSEKKFGKSAASPKKRVYSCPYCRGTGRVTCGGFFSRLIGANIDEECRLCDGSGKVLYFSEIPKGKKICTNCSGFGKVPELLNYFFSCMRCNGEGLEREIPSGTSGKNFCSVCGGFGKVQLIKNSNYYMPCIFCLSSGFESARSSEG